MLTKRFGRPAACTLAAALAAAAGLLAAGPAQASSAPVAVSPGSPFIESATTVTHMPGVAPASGTSYVATAWLSAQSGTAAGTLCLYGSTGHNCTDYSVTAGSYSMVQVAYDPDDITGDLQFEVTATSGTIELENPSVLPSLVESSSFEGSSTGWAKLVPSGATVNMALYNTADGAPAAAHDGSGYLATNTNTAGGGVYQEIELAYSSSYLATAWLSSQSGSATGQLCLVGALGATNPQNCIPYSVSAGTYTPVQLVWDNTADDSFVKFEILPSANGGTTDIDTVSLVQNQLASGSFEGTYAGWSKWIPTGATVNMALYNTADGAPATAHDGDGYLAFNSNPAGGGVAAEAPWSDTEGAAYVATAWLSSQSGTATGSLCLWGLGTADTDSCQPYTVTAGTYSEVQVVYDIPADSTSANEYNVSNLEVQLDAGAGTTDMDTVSLAQSMGPLDS
jgi:hypothetical protein